MTAEQRSRANQALADQWSQTHLDADEHGIFSRGWWEALEWVERMAKA